MAFGSWMCRRKHHKISKTPTYIHMTDIREPFQFDFSTIRAATHNFSDNNKLGEGSTGKVYKGVLEDGREIAVKRFSKSSQQDIIRFKIQYPIISRLQHENLVKILGFCLAAKEEILTIWEYLRNLSLDQFLSDPTKISSLNWQYRFKVIVGIARGLTYLHEDSLVIHRNLKSSNILLDESMNPKISDVALRQLLGVDPTQDDSCGYMAPEYMMIGQFSKKSDIYSFGVIVLEIVSGQKNKFFGGQHPEEAIVHRAWRLWNEGSALDLVDPNLGNEHSEEEVLKCIQIGLLCIQKNAEERPNMATVSAALSGKPVCLPTPITCSFFENVSTTSETYA